MSEERRKTILQTVEADGRVRVDDLSAQFGVSEVTIRKDLADLEARGLLQRTHGGAVLMQRAQFNPSFIEKAQMNSAAKLAIAEAAAAQVADGDALVLDAGTTTLALARILKTRFERLTVITSSIPIAMELAETRFDVLLLGGHVRQHSLAIVGPAAVDMMLAHHAAKAFIGATGATLNGYSTPNVNDADLKRAMIASSDAAYILTDASKIGRNTLARYARLEDGHVLITDYAAPPDFLQALDARGARYVVVTPAA
jgi:DeoR family transcriptional regulator of aga operon/DeoR family fructose operon transcriptional repressor